MTDVSRIVRSVAGAVVAVVAVAGAAAGVLLGTTDHTTTPIAITVPPVPAPTQLTCDGPLLAIGRNAGAAAQVSVAHPQTVTTATVPGTAAPTVRSLSAPAVEGPGGPEVVTAQPSGRTAARVAASGAASAADPDMTGFAVSACHPSLMQSWLVGGASTTGSADLVVLANPGVVPATVELTVYGPQGAEVPPGASGIVVAPGTQQIVPLAGLVLGATTPIVQVVASGAPVQASLQTSIVRTLVPGGVDQVDAIATAADALVIPGLRIQHVDSDDDSPTTMLRIMATAKGTSAVVSVTPSDGKGASPATQKIPLVAGQPVEVELGGLTPGTYTVSVEATAPVVASVWHATGFDAGSDFAWYAPAPALTTATPIAVPAGAGAQLAIANAGSNEAQVTVQQTDGASQTVSVPAGRSVTVPVKAGESYVLDPGGSPVQASVSFSSTGALAAFPVWGTDAASAPITVHP